MEPFLGEIRLFAGNYTPQGWQACDGSLLSIATNDALYALLGTTYGGDGVNTFGVPDLRGRTPLHQGALQSEPGIAYALGEVGGQAAVVLTAAQIPAHTHTLTISGESGTLSDPTGNVLAAIPTDCTLYFEGSTSTTFDGRLIGSAGTSMPHDNMQPYTVMSYIIATEGIFPSQG